MGDKSRYIMLVVFLVSVLMATSVFGVATTSSLETNITEINGKSETDKKIGNTDNKQFIPKELKVIEDSTNDSAEIKNGLQLYSEKLDKFSEKKYGSFSEIYKENGSFFEKKFNKNRDTGWFYMDFNPSSDPHTINGGRFEGSETWTCDHDEWEIGGGTPFDDTGDLSWPSSSYTGIYSAVRDDEDLNDGTTTDGAWCSCAKETGGAWNNEDSRGWATVEKSFDLSDFVDTSKPNFAFTDAIFYCDYKIKSNDFNCDDSHVYFHIYLDDGDDEWPIAYEYFSDSNDAPSETDGGYCIDFWDPDYSGGTDPDFTYDNYNNDKITVNTYGNGQQDVAYLYDFFNNYGDSYTLKFKIFVRLFGGWGGQSERYKYWVDHTHIKCYYEYYYPDLTVLDIWTEPETFYHGDNVDIKTKIKNIGDGSTSNSFYIKMYFDNNLIGYALVPSNMPAGQIINVVYEDYEWPDDIDTHTIKVTVDEEDYVDESDETNNELEEDFQALNHAPTKPSLTGQTQGYHNQEYSYTISATDDDGDDVKYYIAWGDGTNTGWIGWYNSGESVTKKHTWSEPGDYTITAKAKDEFGDVSSEKTLQINMENRNPATPNTPSGETNGYHGMEYTYSTSTTDPDGDQIKYYFDWGDGTGDWTSLYNSGDTAEAAHTWEDTGDFDVKVYAKDEFGGESGWSQILQVYMGNRAPNLPYDPNPENRSDWVDIDDDLSWKCDDEDGDELEYDIYFGITNPPPLVKQNHPSKTYDPGTMDPETTYYWKITAYDNWDNTVGPIWLFTTRTYNPPELTNYNGWPEGVDKEWGTCSDSFTFKVHYYDQDGDPPKEKKLYVKPENGQWQNYDMQGNGADADYTVTLQGNEFGGGTHAYYFEYTDITGQSDQLPEGYYWYFTVNYAPDKPDIVGDGIVGKDKPYTIYVTATDKDGDQIQYYIDWGDGKNSGWIPINPIDSGTTIQKNHTYFEREDYEIKVKARDINGDEGKWGTHIVTVSKNNNLHNEYPQRLSKNKEMESNEKQGEPFFHFIKRISDNLKIIHNTMIKVR